MIDALTQPNKLNEMFPNGIPTFVNTRVEFFHQIDKEYIKFAKNDREHDGIVFSPKHIKDKSWNGLWLRATGMDLNLYINWLYAGWNYGKHQKKTLTNWYRETYPRERYVPFAIIAADEDLQKVLKKKV